MAHEIYIGDVALYGFLTADSELTDLLAEPPAIIGGESVYFDTVPQQVEPGSDPVILIRHMPGRDDDDFVLLGGQRVWSRGRIQIVANAFALFYEAVAAAAARLDELLNPNRRPAQIQTDDGQILCIIRKSPYIRTYQDDHGEFKELGGNYEWIIKAA